MTDHPNHDPDTDALMIAESTAATDTAIPDDQEPQIPGDSGILLGSEATTIARNESLADASLNPEDPTSRSADAGSRPRRRSDRRGRLRRR